MSRRRFRDRLPFAPKHEADFRWRSQGSSRLEGLSDAVFGFALTLLVVSTEAPRDFAGLINVLREFPPFVACFTLLMYFWNEHYRFFRRYGLEDLTTRMLNYVILLLVVFSIYPLKFLFTGWFAFMLGPQYGPTSVKSLPLNELYALFSVYGTGMAAIFASYALLFRHAWRRRDELQLTMIERVETRASIGEFSIQVGVCAISVLLARLQIHPILPGAIYGTLGIFLWLNGWWHARQVDAARAARITTPDARAKNHLS